MKQSKETIPYYTEINDLLASIPMSIRTHDPLCFCLKLHKGGDQIFKPPFRRGFYYIALLTNAKQTNIQFDNTKIENTESILLFQPPGLVYSFYRASSTEGLLIYFKADCFSFFNPVLEEEFPFFDNLHTDFMKIDDAQVQSLKPHFEEVFAAHTPSNASKNRVAYLKLLALLYVMKDLIAFRNWQERVVSNEQVLFRKFTRLVNNHYIEKRTVDDYAQLLAITPNHLSKSVKLVSGKNALSFIHERLVAEAKSLISYTNYDMAEIAYRLNFSEPANFSNFFKRHTNLTPLEFSKAIKE